MIKITNMLPLGGSLHGEGLEVLDGGVITEEPGQAVLLYGGHLPWAQAPEPALALPAVSPLPPDPE